MTETPSTTPAMPDDQRALRLILGPRAASLLELREAVERLRVDWDRVDVRLTWEQGDASRWAERASRQRYAAVGAAGGDGTLNEVVNGLYAGADAGGTLPTLAILPYGTANDFASGCGLPVERPLHALDLLNADMTREVDVGRVGDERFLNVVTGGLGVEATADAPDLAKKALGGFAYFLRGLAKVNDPRRYSLRIRGPGFEWTGQTMAFAIGNGRRAGGGLELCPRAELDDGLLDLGIVPDLPFDQLVPVIREGLFGGDPLALDEVIYRQLPWFEIESDEELQINLDGEPVYGHAFRFEIEPKRLCVALAAPSEPTDG